MPLVLTTTENHIATVTINRPEALNAMNLALVQALQETLDELINNDKVSIIILTGSGDRAFVAGADIKAMQAMDKKAAYQFGEKGQRLMNTIADAPKPVIAAVNGFALGGGCELSLACHLRVASNTARFAQPEVHLGIIPGWGGTQRLRHLVGLGSAYELILSGRMIDADEAHRIGLVNAVVPPEELLPAAKNLAESILANGPQAIAKAMHCIRAGLDEGLERGLQSELKTFSELFETPETREGLAAFVEKRKPRFR
jgi:enoyl-CoA hydratase